MNYRLAMIFLLTFGLVQGQELTKVINDYTDTYVKTGDFNGCILITKADKILYQNCFGYANSSFAVPNKKQTRYKIGSVSKQFTAAAILKLEESGLLSTSDTLSNYFPGNTNAEKITIEQLLTHTSGAIDIFSVPVFNKLSYEKLGINTLAEMVLASDLEFEPGSQYQYSNGGYALLAAIIEQVSGTQYGAYLKEHIFDPLKMNATGHPQRNEVVQNLAVGYDPLGYSNIKITEFLDPELLKGSGSLYSSIEDLQVWIESIKKKTLLSKESYAKLLRDYGHNYGFGISVYTSFDQSVFGHDGRINGYIADYLHYQESGISIIILGNIQTGVADFLRRDVAAIVFGKDYKSRAKTILPAENGLWEIEKLLGTYSFGPGFKVYVEFLEGGIQARANEGGYSELIPLQDGRYFSRTLYSYITFKGDEEGLIEKMIWTNNNGNSFEGKKEK